MQNVHAYLRNRDCLLGYFYSRITLSIYKKIIHSQVSLIIVNYDNFLIRLQAKALSFGTPELKSDAVSCKKIVLKIVYPSVRYESTNRYYAIHVHTIM